MTYGVPYSFVPGTKAKADEVNANFIDVLNKIEETNTRVTENATQNSSAIENLNTQLSTDIANCANLDLSNISSAGQALFNAKADKTSLDGSWVYSNKTIASDKTISAGATQNFSLSSILPNDSKKYEMILSINVTTVSGGEFLYLFCHTDFLKADMAVCRMFSQNSNDRYGGTTFNAVSSTGRQISIVSTSAGTGSIRYTLKLAAYRKVS